MPDKKITELTALTTADATDVLPIVDVSAVETKKITKDNLLAGLVVANSPITPATKTKVTYDADGLITSGTDATTADIADSSNKRYVTDAQEAKIDFLTVTQPVDLDAIETRVNSLDAAVILRGVWDASAGTFPGGGTAQAGDSYIVSVGGTVDSQVFVVNDRIIAITDNASTGTFAANWFKADYTDQVLSVNGLTGAVTIPTATETVSGTAEMATDAETQTGTDIITIVNPLKLATWWTWVKTQVQTFAAKITFTTAPRFSSVTASEILEVDANKDLISAAKGTAYNKAFGTGTTNVPEIGTTLGNSQAVHTDSSGKLKTATGPTEADIASTITWTGTTAPSSPASLKEAGYQVGKLFTGWLRLEYDVAGSALTVLTVVIPATWPTPMTITEWDNSELAIPVLGLLVTSATGTPAASRAWMEKTAGGVIRFAVQAASGNYGFAIFNITYPTA